MGETFSSDWGDAPSQELAPVPKQTAGQRLREAFANVDPAVKEKAVQAAIGVGSEALKGSGIMKETRDGSLRVSKRGVVKAALNPHNAVRKGLFSGGKEAKNMAKSAATEQAYTTAHRALSGAAASAEAWVAQPQPSEAAWGAPIAEAGDWGDPTPISPALGTTYNASPSTWVETPSHNWETPIHTFTEAPQQTPAWEQPAASYGYQAQQPPAASGPMPPQYPGDW